MNNVLYTDDSTWVGTLDRCVSQRCAGFPIAISIEIGVPLAQQFLGFGMGADLAAAVTAAARGGAIRNDARATTSPEVPGPADAALHLLDTVSTPAGTVFRVQILLGIAAAQVLAVHKSLTVFHQRQVDVHAAEHLGN
jgi:hypothetical protein